MKKLWLHSVRAYLRLGMFFYFEKVVVHNIENIPKDKPVLLLGNHQNALLDPLLIATKGSRFSFFLTRAAVFKKKFISNLLGSLQMLPVYRIRDGWNNLANNNAIFETCSELLKDGEAIVIFPEGNHNLARRVRPLSKGFTRIVFDTLEKYPDLDLQLVPVGLNYVHAAKFSDSAALFFGKPISAKEFTSDNRNEGIVKLKSKIQTELMKLTTHIPSDNYESDLLLLQELNVDFLNPQEVNTCIANSFKDCKIESNSKFQFLKGIFKILLIINLIIPYVVWKLLAEPKIVELEFKSTFRFTIALTLVPIWLLVITMLLVLNFSWAIGLFYLSFSLVLALLAIKW
ncbi:lysophospholipid acyltransferase family protein [Seonamhaeicola maritimus]|uniref:lysophospholipid acyltransferase family protein n=1 Tax=Seonamhaeicola maritimus TaxID=2591822 RepID=UPI002495383C|nr:lysophospholipid acyltransferase family protein [Seonamhaeicola maritimus]